MVLPLFSYKVLPMLPMRVANVGVDVDVNVELCSLTQMLGTLGRGWGEGAFVDATFLYEFFINLLEMTFLQTILYQTENQGTIIIAKV